MTCTSGVVPAVSDQAIIILMCVKHVFCPMCLCVIWVQVCSFRIRRVMFHIVNACPLCHTHEKDKQGVCTKPAIYYSWRLHTHMSHLIHDTTHDTFHATCMFEGTHVMPCGPCTCRLFISIAEFQKCCYCWNSSLASVAMSSISRETQNKVNALMIQATEGDILQSVKQIFHVLQSDTLMWDMKICESHDTWEESHDKKWESHGKKKWALQNILRESW